jgi:transcriptional regulator with XRE-family HTH domain
MVEFAYFLREIRSKSGCTQTQFAAKLGIDTAALSKIENAKKEFDPRKLIILSQEFSIDIEELKSRFFGEKIALELHKNKCPIETFKVVEEKFHYFEENT